MTLNHVGDCCNEVNIQSDGPSSIDPSISHNLGDYIKYENDNNVYKNIMNSDGIFLYRDSIGHWTVCTNCQYSLLQDLVIL